MSRIIGIIFVTILLLAGLALGITGSPVLGAGALIAAGLFQIAESIDKFSNTFAEESDADRRAPYRRPE